MAEELVKSWAEPKFFEDLDIAIKGLKEVVGGIVEANNAAKKGEGFASQSSTIKDVVTAGGQLEAQHKKLALTYDQLSKAAQVYTNWKERSNGSTDKEMTGTGKVLKLKIEEEKARRASAQALEAENKAKLSVLRVDQQREAQQKRNTAADQAANDSLKTMSATLEQHRKSYALLTAAERENEHIGGVLLTRIQQLDKQLKSTDATLGVYRRNVGNYSSAFNGLGSSIQQVARELPNFAISFRTGIQALSNNLPILADEIRRVRVENAALAAEGKPTTSVLKQIAGAVFNWQTALIAVITALVAYAPQIAEFISGTEDAAKKQEDLKKATEETTTALQDQIDTLFKARQREGGRLNLGEAEAKRRLDLLKAQGASEKDILDAQLAFFAARRRSIENEIGSYKVIRDEINRAGQFFRQREQSEGLETGSLNGLFSQSVQKALRDELKLTAEEAKKQADIIADSYGSALSPVRDIQTKILDLNEDLKNADNDGRVAQAESLKKQLEADEKRRKKAAEDAKRAAEARQKALDEETEQTLKATKGMYEKRLAIAKDAVQNEKLSLQERLANIDKALLDEVSIVQLNGAIQHKTREEIEADITEMVLKYNKLRTEIVDKEGKEQADRIKKNLGSITGNGQTESRDDFDKKVKGQRDSMKIYAESAIQTQEAIAELNRQITNRRLQEIDEEIEAINRKRDAEIEGINASSLSAVEKEKKIAEAKALAEGKTKQLEQDKINRMRRAAQFEKSVNIASIIARTALAVITAWTEGDPYTKVARSIAAGAAGASQLAIALAAPLPQYEDGTQGKPHKGGPAVLFEGNKAEAVIENGKVWMGNKEGVYNLSKGAEVISNKELLELSRHYALGLPMLVPQGGQANNADVVQGLNDLKAAINNKPVAQFNVTGMGMQRLTKQANNITEYINSFSS